MFTHQFFREGSHSFLRNSLRRGCCYFFFLHRVVDSPFASIGPFLPLGFPDFLLGNRCGNPPTSAPLLLSFFFPGATPLFLGWGVDADESSPLPIPTTSLRATSCVAFFPPFKLSLLFFWTVSFFYASGRSVSPLVLAALTTLSIGRATLPWAPFSRFTPPRALP